MARVAKVWVAVLLVGTACSSRSDEKSAGTGGGGGAAAEAGTPRGGEGNSTPDAQPLKPLSVWQPELPTEGEFCSFLVAVECDGTEDCADGKVCCGTVNGGSLSYDSIRCQDSCDLAAGGRVLCHPGDACADPEQECIRSLILPPYLGICGTRGAFTPEGFEAGSTAPGEINCAPGHACTGGDVCCALTSWQAETQKASFIDGVCAATAEECGCKGGTAPVAVALPDGGFSEDGGADAAAANDSGVKGD